MLSFWLITIPMWLKSRPSKPSVTALMASHIAPQLIFWKIKSPVCNCWAKIIAGKNSSISFFILDVFINPIYIFFQNLMVRQHYQQKNSRFRSEERRVGKEGRFYV